MSGTFTNLEEADDAALIRVCRADELEAGEAIRVEARVPIAVFNDGGQFFAVGDTCTHEKASLSEGYLDQGEIECPLHASRFDIRTGRVLCRPATESLPIFRVLLRGEHLYVEDVAHISPSA